MFLISFSLVIFIDLLIVVAAETTKPKIKIKKTPKRFTPGRFDLTVAEPPIKRLSYRMTLNHYNELSPLIELQF